MANYRLSKTDEKKNKGQFSKRIITSMLVFLLIFTVSNMVLFYITKQEPSTLIMAVFGFCGAEGGYTTYIKMLDKKKDKKCIKEIEGENNYE